MFTGIVEAQGQIRAIKNDGTNKTFIIESSIAHDLNIDQSLSHDGVCLTVEACHTSQYEVTLIHETLIRSNLGSKQIGDRLNLERCLKVSDRLDGHLVQGHVDCTARCKRIIDHDGSWEFSFDLDPAYSDLVVSKGSICINGISLTISDLLQDVFRVSIIPYTFQHTNMSALSIDDFVNIEFDILGKYVARQQLRR